MSETEIPILEKIQKLLNLQKGAETIGSLHEAELAAQRVTDLLLKYNLEMEDVNSFQKPDAKDIQRFDEHQIVNPKNEGQWLHSLYHVIARHNFCQVIRIVMRLGDDYISIIGTKDNVVSVKFLSEQLESRIRIAEKEAWKINTSSEKRNAFRRGFFMGAVRGIDMQLHEKRRKEEAANVKVTALVVTNKDKLERFLKEEFNNITSGKQRRGLSSNTGYAMGHQTGRNMNINKGVDGSNNNTKMLN